MNEKKKKMDIMNTEMKRSVVDSCCWDILYEYEKFCLKIKGNL